MGLIVDSSVLIQMERRGLTINEVAPQDENLAMSAITASEMLAGLHRAQTDLQRSSRQTFLDGVFARMPVLPFDREAAEVHARLWAELTVAGQRIGPHDLLIAATALAHGHALLTLNVREFSRVPGLEVRTPNW